MQSLFLWEKTALIPKPPCTPTGNLLLAVGADGAKVHGRGMVVNDRGMIMRHDGRVCERCSRGQSQCTCNDDSNNFRIHHKNSLLLIRWAKGCL